jgi:hypothetical protein
MLGLEGIVAKRRCREWILATVNDDKQQAQASLQQAQVQLG